MDLMTFIAKSEGGLFEKTGLIKLPVSEKVKNDFKNNPGLRGDTTGCGDNFTGGIIYSVASQLAKNRPGHLDLTEALSWGIASGGFICFTVGRNICREVSG